MTYNREELDFKDGSAEEQERTRKIFEDLKSKTNSGRKLSEYEKDFFCQGVNLSNSNDGKIGDYICCDNYKFKITYLTYFHDLSGFGTYEKVKDTSLYHPEQNEVNKDIEYLKKVATDWYFTISKTNHSEELIRQISIESRKNLTLIEKSKGKLLFRRDKEKFILDKRAALLQSKFIYCVALLIFEMFDREEFILSLNGKEIEINEFSITHILSRHFAQITKPNSKKSFHVGDFTPRYLNKQLKEVFQDIDDSGLLRGKTIDKIAFKYKNIDYVIYINERTKQVKGEGNVSFNRLETCFPVTHQDEKAELNNNFNLEPINDDLSIYVKK